MKQDLDYFKSDFRKNWLGWLELPDWREGNSGNSVDYQTFMFDFVKEKQPRSILEIGFNAGHSACCFLNASPRANLVAFDICIWGTEQPAAEALSKYFDIELVKGDSTETVPEYMQSHDDTFDFVFVDGGHRGDTPYLDIANTKDRVNPGGYILIDNMEEPPVEKAFERVDWSDYEEELTGIHQPNNPSAPNFPRKDKYQKYTVMKKNG